MKQGIHPEYVDCTVKCSCGNTFQTRSTKPELKIDICNVCHPFYTGQQRFVDTGGRVQRFADKFGAAKETVAEREAAKKAARAAAIAEAEAKKKAERKAKAAERPSAPRSSPRSPRPRLRRPPRLRLPPRPLPRLRPRKPPRWTLSSKRLLPPNSASAASTANARSMTGRSCVQGRSARVVARKPWFSPSKRGFRATTASVGPLQARPSLDRRTPRRAATPRPKGRLRPIPLRRGARRAARSTSCTRPAPRL